jgi:hypothetical protein
MSAVLLEDKVDVIYDPMRYYTSSFTEVILRHHHMY